MAIDDDGKEMELSSDPLLNTLKDYVSEIKLSKTKKVGNKLKPILSNEEIFGVNLITYGKRFFIICQRKQGIINLTFKGLFEAV
jgi:hypothetical protein